MKLCILIIEGTILTLDDLSPVYDKLIKAAVKWFNLGLKLEVSPDTLINIRDEYRDKNHICLREMLIARLNTATLTYSEICQSLRAPTVARNDVAEAIEEACTGMNSHEANLDQHFYGLISVYRILKPGT